MFDTAIFYQILDTDLGKLLIAATKKGLCSVKLGDDAEGIFEEFRQEFKGDNLVQDKEYLAEYATSLTDYISGKAPWPNLPYDIRLSPFKKEALDFLYNVPSGVTYTYSEAAKQMGKPKAIRAFASALASNPVAIVIPCHRIVPKSGGIGQYRWHPKRKARLLELERS